MNTHNNSFATLDDVGQESTQMTTVQPLDHALVLINLYVLQASNKFRLVPSKPSSAWAALKPTTLMKALLEFAFFAVLFILAIKLR